jgi:hypothetical protein
MLTFITTTMLPFSVNKNLTLFKKILGRIDHVITKSIGRKIIPMADIFFIIKGKNHTKIRHVKKSLMPVFATG